MIATLRRYMIVFCAVVLTVVGVWSGAKAQQADASSERDWLSYTEFATKEDMLNAGLAAFKAEDYAVAIKLLLPLAIDGTAKAQALLAEMYRDGLGVPEDQCVATIWGEKAARQGDLFGAWMLSFAYHRGKGVRRDFELAYRWMKYAALHGDEKAQEELSFMSNELSSEQIAQIDQDMATWDPAKQPAPEFYYVHKNTLFKEHMLLGITHLKLGVSWCP